MPNLNLGESLRQKLKNLSLKNNRPFDEILRYYAMERFLYRLSLSRFADRFFLKGGLMFKVWNPLNHRATLDIDFLAKTSNSTSNIRSILFEISSIDCPEDAVQFDTTNLLLKEIQIGGGYFGTRASFSAQLFTTKIPLLLDIGFDDIIHPHPKKIAYPTLLFPKSFQLYGYPLETVVAEKFESIVKLGLINTRMKDFYDLWMILKKERLDSNSLGEAIRKIFLHRETPLQMPLSFTPAFYENPETLRKWKTFLNTLGENEIDLHKVIFEISEKLKLLISL